MSAIFGNVLAAMNLNWKAFLLSQEAVVDEDNVVIFPRTVEITGNRIYSLNHLAVLTVAGQDAAKLLQGQITCNVNDVTVAKSSLSAICNPKGRAIATFLLVKKSDTFLLILPLEMLEIIRKRLQMFVLRSDVNIMDSSDYYCLLGLSSSVGRPSGRFFTETQQDSVAVSFSGPECRKLLITDVDNAINFWSEQVVSHGYCKADTDSWRYLDMMAGIPWVTTATSEEFVPQMLNLDKLGGISFNKGCYTGQEIVARTHYLGKSKREMFLATCESPIEPERNASVINLDNDEQQTVGKILLTHCSEQICTLLVVIQTDYIRNNLGLKDYNQVQLRILPFNE